MNDLQKIKKSCEDFSNTLKTGNVSWQEKTNKGFNFFIVTDLLFLGQLELWLSDVEDICFKIEINGMRPVKLKAKTAEAAAFEALEWVKK